MSYLKEVLKQENLQYKRETQNGGGEIKEAQWWVYETYFLSRASIVQGS